MNQTQPYLYNFQSGYQDFQQKIGAISKKAKISKSQIDTQKLQHELDLINQQMQDQGLQFNANSIFSRYAQIQQLAQKKKQANDCCFGCGQEIKKPIQCQFCAELFCKSCCWRKRIIPFQQSQDHRLCCVNCHENYIKLFNNQKFFKQKADYLKAIEDLAKKYQKTTTKYQKKKSQIKQYDEQKRKGKVKQGILKKELLQEQRKIQKLKQQFIRISQQKTRIERQQEDKRLSEQKQKHASQQRIKMQNEKRIQQQIKKKKQIEQQQRLSTSRLALLQVQKQKQSMMLQIQRMRRQKQQLERPKQKPQKQVEIDLDAILGDVAKENQGDSLSLRRGLSSRQIQQQQIKLQKQQQGKQQVDFGSIIMGAGQNKNGMSKKRDGINDHRIDQQQQQIQKIFNNNYEKPKEETKDKNKQEDIKQPNIKPQNIKQENVKQQNPSKKEQKIEQRVEQPQIIEQPIPQPPKPVVTMTQIKTMSINDLLAMKIPMNPNTPAKSSMIRRKDDPVRKSQPDLKLDNGSNQTAEDNSETYAMSFNEPMLMGYAGGYAGEETPINELRASRQTQQDEEVKSFKEQNDSGMTKNDILRMRSSLISSTNKQSINRAPQQNEAEFNPGPQKCTCEVM